MNRMDDDDTDAAESEVARRAATPGTAGSPEADCLIGSAAALDRLLPHERRQEELLARAEADGVEREFAEQVYAVAQDIGLEPVYAFALVRCGIGVQPLDEQVYGAATGDDEEMQAQEPPTDLLVPDGAEPAAALRERQLRTSCRRLKRHLAGATDAEAALRAFTAEPDVGPLAY